jgi:hypothetical protein
MGCGSRIAMYHYLAWYIKQCEEAWNGGDTVEKSSNSNPLENPRVFANRGAMPLIVKGGRLFRR